MMLLGFVVVIVCDSLIVVAIDGVDILFMVLML